MPAAVATRNRARAVRPNPLLSQAQQAATARYGPEETQLRSLLRQAYTDLVNGAQLHSSVADGIKAAAIAAAPQLTAGYRNAGATVGEAHQAFSNDVHALSAAADPYKGAGDREAQQAVIRLAEAESAGQHDLADRQVRAEEGRAYGLTNLMRTYNENAGKVADRQGSLQQEKGAFIASTYGDLQAAQAKAEADAQNRAQTAAYQQGLLALGQGRQDVALAQLGETGRHNRATENIGQQNANTQRQRAAGTRAAAGEMSAAQARTATAQINKAWNFLRGFPHKLQSGPNKGKVVTREAALEGLKSGQGLALSDPLYGQAAYDLLKGSRISSQTYHQLRGQGYRPPGQWLPQRRPPAPTGQGLAGLY